MFIFPSVELIETSDFFAGEDCMEINLVFINAVCLLIWVNSCIIFPCLITEHSVVN